MGQYLKYPLSACFLIVDFHPTRQMMFFVLKLISDLSFPRSWFLQLLFFLYNLPKPQN